MVAAVVAVIMSVIVVWYMTGRRIAIHEHGVHAHEIFAKVVDRPTSGSDLMVCVIGSYIL
jgi:hypothetical protein